MRLHRSGALRTLAAALALSGAAAAVDFTPHGTQPVLASPLLGSRSCAGCHADPGVVDRHFMPYNAWSGSMMANSARDPLFWAALDVANADVPGAGDACLRCHAPQAWWRGHVAKGPGGGPVDGADGCLLQGDHDDLETPANDYDGVGCHLCHRTQEAPAGAAPLPIGDAVLWLDDAATCQGFPGPCRRGPYRYPDAAGNAPPPHGWIQSALHADSALCGNCHDAASPPGVDRRLVLADGTDSGRPFPLDRTYGEWRASAAGDLIFTDGFAFNEPLAGGRKHGVTCQECHLRPATGIENSMARACIDNPRGGRKDHLPVHEFAGGNAWMPQVLKSLYPALARDAEFDRTTSLALDNLAQRSAQLDLTLTSQGTALQAHVRVTNRTGHKLPTGYAEARRMWLEVVARDANGTALWRSGTYDDATATLDAGDAPPRVYEARRGRWNAQSQRCEAGNGAQFHTLLADCIALDTRIPPEGFAAGDDPTLAPVGRDYPETAPGSGRRVNYDDVDYAIALPADTVGPVTVTATLRYQTLTRDYADFLRDTALASNTPSENALCANRRAPLPTGPRTQSRAAFLHDAWQANGRAAPVTVRAASAVADPPISSAITPSRVFAPAR